MTREQYDNYLRLLNASDYDAVLAQQVLDVRQAEWDADTRSRITSGGS